MKSEIALASPGRRSELQKESNNLQKLKQQGVELFAPDKGGDYEVL